jgi:hypothetical protein
VAYNHEEGPDAGLVALSTDGRRIAYQPLLGGLIVRDLVSGESYSPAFDFEIRTGYTWVDGTHLVGHVAEQSDVDGWVWDVLEPGTAPNGSTSERTRVALARAEQGSGPVVPRPGGR